MAVLVPACFGDVWLCFYCCQVSDYTRSSDWTTSITPLLRLDPGVVFCLLVALVLYMALTGDGSGDLGRETLNTRVVWSEKVRVL